MLPLVFTLALSAPAVVSSEPPAFEMTPLGAVQELREFRLAEAQQAADERRRELHGVCGMCVFKERVGDAWVFTVRVGYAGQAAADIIVFVPRRAAETPDSQIRPESVSLARDWTAQSDNGDAIQVDERR